MTVSLNDRKPLGVSTRGAFALQGSPFFPMLQGFGYPG